MKPNLDNLTDADIQNIIRASRKAKAPAQPFLLQVRRKIMRRIVQRLKQQADPFAASNWRQLGPLDA